jgi:hypothetical protein
MSGTTQQLAAESSGVGIAPGRLSLCEPITEFNAVLGTRGDKPRLPLSLSVHTNRATWL